MKNTPDILFSLDDKPNIKQSLTSAVQHILACFVGIITPTLIIGAALGLHAEIPYLISMALFVSGVATFVQAKKFGPVGCGLIAVQGTSFAFVSALLVAGFAVKAKGGSNNDILATMYGVCFVGAFIEIILSQFIEKVKKVITPLTTGIVITTIGISLIKVGFTDLAGGYGSESFGSLQNLSLGLFVLVIIIGMNVSSNPWIRLSAITVGMVLGTVLAYFLGLLSFSNMVDLPTFSMPLPFKYGFNFDWEIFVPVALIYFLTALETSGDITANSLFCGLPIKGDRYLKRIKGGVLADGINSAIAAMFNTFPNTTFGQNNAVIQMTGVTSRHVAFYIAAILVLLGLFPVIGGVLQAIPKPVLGGATLVMFATIAVAGIKILASEPIDRRRSLIISTSLGAGLGVLMVPDAIQQLPEFVKNILSSAVTTAGFTAIFMSLLIPETERVQHEKT
ncbi:uracil-xanthine permease family protein [Agaribacter marinus]|uniref:Xanthine permease n=1 Tax=Agaribacter marinus TaxID=1431249 RepID=A0AA37SZ78_9ALTE|nr:nucleobase:cation symporter-2 family protein [Agaribacter marinus]GLR71932.1 xanthine permease [Agaribacter marinus]